MREIKFRAWNKITNHFSDFTNEHKIGDINSNGLMVFMQYTGLKDKNGVEIYEGDIVRVIDDIGYYGVGIAIFCLGSFCFEWIDDSESNIEPMVTIKKINNNQELEVIGNIYENPELLEE